MAGLPTPEITSENLDLQVTVYNIDHSSKKAVCEDINECRLGYNICQGGRCTNTLGSYHCSCYWGQRFDGSRCTNINECETGEHSCPTNDSCIDTDWSFECKCDFGYYWNGRRMCKNHEIHFHQQLRVFGHTK